MAHCNKNPFDRHFGEAAIRYGVNLDSKHAAFVAGNFLERAIPFDLDLAFCNLGHQPANQDRFGAKLSRRCTIVTFLAMLDR